MKRNASPFVVSLSNHERMPPSRSMTARGQSLFAIAPKVTKNASPCTPLHPAVLATGGMRQRLTKASLTLRTVCADDASTTARCAAPRRGLKGRSPLPQCQHANLTNLSTAIAHAYVKAGDKSARSVPVCIGNRHIVISEIDHPRVSAIACNYARLKHFSYFFPLEAARNNLSKGVNVCQPSAWASGSSVLSSVLVKRPRKRFI